MEGGGVKYKLINIWDVTSVLMGLGAIGTLLGSEEVTIVASKQAQAPVCLSACVCVHHEEKFGHIINTNREACTSCVVFGPT